MRNGKIIAHGINQAKYDKVIDIIEDMRESMTEPLNLSNLIFNPKEDFDIKKMKQEKIQEILDSS
jgi:hypothetical protein